MLLTDSGGINVSTGNLRIAIDRGGTFTDCIANPGTTSHKDDLVIKLLSLDPKNYEDAPLEGIRRILEHFTQKKIPRGTKLDVSTVKNIRIGTTLATNCALERNGEPCALITTRGFKDALLINDQTRPKIFDLNIKRPLPLYDIVLECDERITLEDYSENRNTEKTIPDNIDTFEGLSGETVRVLQKPNIQDIRSMLSTIYAMGINSIAIAFLHSYTYPFHEQLVAKIAKEVGFSHINCSSEVPMIRYLNRCSSAVVDAYLTPVIENYRENIKSGLTIKDSPNDKNSIIGHPTIQFMQSDGGLVNASKFTGLKSILSGPAGGVVGYSTTCFSKENPIPLIGFDMGGTSTDVSRFDGTFSHVLESTTAGIKIQSPQLNIDTVASGGSSRLFWENGLFRVGPESATADPGPAAYRKGGPLTITDANLYLGRLVPELFPSIFGPNEDQPLDIERTGKLFEELTKQINKDIGGNMTPYDVAYGFIQVANATMSRPIRALTEAKGFVVKDHRLVSFGGAGGQHAVFIAELLGIKEVLIHRYSSILSAYGIYLADVVEECQEPCSLLLNETVYTTLNERFAYLENNALGSLISQGFYKKDIEFQKYLNLRYEGTENALMIRRNDNESYNEAFAKQYKLEFGFSFDDRNIIVDDIRIRAIAKSNVRQEKSVDVQLKLLKKVNIDPKTNASFYKKVFFDGKWVDTPVFDAEILQPGSVIYGPAILADKTQTNIIPPNTRATMLVSLIHIQVTSNTENVNKITDAVDPVLLSIFGNRFMDIAEQMGTQLRKTSTSTNVKERLDFSCALFDAEGNLVANAPHVPVHLGSMSTCIAMQAKLWGNRLKPGDVLFTNHPDLGGTHLPDITVITPAFDSDDKIIFYVASRAHHADIGGILPGSVPPNSRELYEEGCTIYSELLVKGNIFQEDLVYRLFVEEPEKYPGCSGARRISDNINDLKAQIAANNRGMQLINQLVSKEGIDVVFKYMKAIQENSATAIKKMLKKLSLHYEKTEFTGHDFMDDGSIIKLKVTLNFKEEKYIFDFNGTSPQIYGNTNAPIAITNSAILYALRCLVGQDIPLNQGCLQPITINIPRDSILCPGKGVAVVGGNVLTSQRVTDVIFKTLNVMADSQGDCNNLTFGTNDFGYYETICGGAGAGADSWDGNGWDGANAVHTNMTNTRMTDPEILERRYPVLLNEFSIREGSGGEGKYKGGNGVIRSIEFREPVQASILSERRVIPPHGLNKGNDGERGENLWYRKDTDSIINIGGKNSIKAKNGDRIIIKTPGGAGYGKKN